jgi:hypothetical protein
VEVPEAKAAEEEERVKVERVEARAAEEEDEKAVAAMKIAEHR